MAIQVPMQNPTSGEIKLVKVGWSWTLFFLSGIFGIPLFRRKLMGWGCLFFAINIVSGIANVMPTNASAALLLLIVNLLAFVLLIFLGLKGNEITAKNYLARGWKFVEPNSDMTKFAKMKWQIFEHSTGTPIATQAPSS